MIERESARIPGAERVLVYVWDLPVWILHWTIVVMIVCLTPTGFRCVTQPLIEVRDLITLLMADVRLAHLFCGCIFAAAAAGVLGRYGSNHIHAIPGKHVAEFREVCQVLDVDFDGFGGL